VSTTGNVGPVYFTGHKDEDTWWVECWDKRGWTGATGRREDLLQLCRDAVNFWSDTEPSFVSRGGVVLVYDGCALGLECTQ
jgi:hypothetical protein